MQVWLMAACSKGYTLSRDHVNLVLTIVQQASIACTLWCAADCGSESMPSAHACSSVALVQIAAVPVRDSSLPDSGEDSAADDDAATGAQQASDERLAAIDAALQPNEAALVKVCWF